MLCIVQKEYEGSSRQRVKIGTILESDHIPLGRQLIAQRYIRPLTVKEAATLGTTPELTAEAQESQSQKTSKRKNA